MTEFDPLAEFARLLEDFPRLFDAVQAHPLSAENDGIAPRLALAGFTLHCPADTWTAQDLAAIKEYRQHMPSGVFSPAWICFSCVAFGYLLGLRRSGRVSELQALHADSLLPGFMTMNRGKLEGLYMATQIKPAPGEG